MMLVRNRAEMSAEPEGDSNVAPLDAQTTSKSCKYIPYMHRSREIDNPGSGPDMDINPPTLAQMTYRQA